MLSFQHTKILPYKPKKLFDLVWDIKSYPQFLPWCAAARIISENNQEVISELVIQLKGLSEKYNSRVINTITDNGIYLIDTVAISGPFEYLKSTWQFIPHSTGTELKFFINFKMTSVILDKLIGSYFTIATEKMILAFEKRAKEVIK
ncbi:type II toxin-antitoxin system RatA family toxin [Rickettsia prowazekii]|uniref:Ribosome association toxin RatA n=2 Tax=Rickettsia prowazekii TaxID=782 RepID=RATA_RICPR|nr:type II toxin-antitoxin system RatA family toxin [Rickettsia prowazekii]Q9ZDZ7.1 RecName: Full=Ribosome association toxin RatA [Rickettsia prowazekii str. Madrid E]ADE29675.1 Oligoketide cyclase/lipid transport protein [Rickettsia prowazekii str. Rp22]AFE48987.1 oligoketide cyclase/lipid transport protein [Rickettsia prowazekii str. Chernikova]AFE49832.1 oligoketide cyclase/lipid transport protein [Rickettsia prowazekii str. Katsinyian]AFE50676.1 oligoketide cyclase/lipid transport protein 